MKVQLVCKAITGLSLLAFLVQSLHAQWGLGWSVFAVIMFAAVTA